MRGQAHRGILSRKSGYTIEMFHLDTVFLKISRTCTLTFIHAHQSVFLRVHLRLEFHIWGMV